MSRALDYFRLTKPRLTLMALATAFTGFYMAHAGKLNLILFLNAALGSALVGGGANTLNQYLERFRDARMIRTQKRPLPDKRLGEKEAFGFGSFLSFAGIAELWIFVNSLTAVIALITLLTYLFLYTPLKPKTILNTLVGAFSGAAPCLMGWAAAGGPLTLQAWALFLIVFVWQLPHFLAIAWVYREDYERAGFRMLPIRDPAGVYTSASVVAFTVLLFAVSLVPARIGMAGLTYLFMAVFGGIFLTGFAVYVALNKLAEVKKFIPLSIIYLFLLNVSLIIDKT